MDKNLYAPIQAEFMVLVAPAFNAVKELNQFDEQAWELKVEDISKTQPIFFTLVIYPILLEYTNKAEIWYKCLIKDLEEGEMDYISHFFKDTVFPQLPWEPFHDEDAKLGYFSHKQKKTRGHEIAFFINPSYPEGVWENHAIECA